MVFTVVGFLVDGFDVESRFSAGVESTHKDLRRALVGVVVGPYDDEVAVFIGGDIGIGLIPLCFTGVDDDFVIAREIAAAGVHDACVDVVVFLIAFIVVFARIVFPNDDELPVWHSGDI